MIQSVSVSPVAPMRVAEAAYPQALGEALIERVRLSAVNNDFRAFQALWHSDSGATARELRPLFDKLRGQADAKWGVNRVTEAQEGAYATVVLPLQTVLAFFDYDRGALKLLGFGHPF